MQIFAALTTFIIAAFPTANPPGIYPKQVKNFVTFGDSYTDVVDVSHGGLAWPTYAARYANLALYSFARTGATCSNNITYLPYPSIMENQIPLFLEKKANGTLKLDPEETLYTLWIGTNDIGSDTLLTGTANASLVDVTNCMIEWVKIMYENGARNILFQNMIPLETTPLYSADSWPNRYWPAPRNTTEWNVFMKELVLTGNRLTELMLQALAPALHDAHIGIFDSHSLFTDMYNHPQLYLNGTAPLNVTSCVNACVYKENGTVETCSNVTGTAVDSFLWSDELHPSEQADRNIAREIATLVKTGKNRWTTWLS